MPQPLQWRIYVVCMEATWQMRPAISRAIVAVFSLCKPTFSPRIFPVGFILDTVASEQSFAKHTSFHSFNAPYSSVIRGWYSGPIWGWNTKELTLMPLIQKKRKPWEMKEWLMTFKSCQKFTLYFPVLEITIRNVWCGTRFSICSCSSGNRGYCLKLPWSINIQGMFNTFGS
jgi:hypothetical protein